MCVYILSINFDYNIFTVIIISFDYKLFIYLIFTRRISRKWIDFIFTIVLNLYCNTDFARSQIKT